MGDFGRFKFRLSRHIGAIVPTGHNDGICGVHGEERFRRDERRSARLRGHEGIFGESVVQRITGEESAELIGVFAERFDTRLIDQIDLLEKHFALELPPLPERFNADTDDRRDESDTTADNDAEKRVIHKNTSFRRDG